MFPSFQKVCACTAKAEKPLYERIPLPDQRPALFFTSIPPFHKVVFAKLIQSFTVSKHLWVRYYNNSSGIIFM